MKCSLVILNAISDHKEHEKSKSTNRAQSNQCFHICNTILHIVFKGSNNKSSSICNHHKESDKSIDDYS